MLFATYTPGVTPLIATSDTSEQIFVVLNFKSKTDKITKQVIPAPASQYTIVPNLQGTEVLSDVPGLCEVVKGMLGELQERMVRAVYDKEFETCGNGDLDDVLRFWNENASSKRLSSETIEQWFKTDMHEVLIDRMVAKNPQISSEMIKGTLAVTLKNYQTLSAVTPSLTKDTAKKLL